MSANYKIRKVQKKQRRCRAIITNECDIQSSEVPTKFLAILNAGLSTGLTGERVISEASCYGNLQTLLMLPGKSYAFLVCSSAEDAERIYAGLHNKALLGQDSAVVYLSYFEAIPSYDDPWKKPRPKGLILLKDFVTEEEEKELLKAVGTEMNSNQETATLKNRLVFHFGYEFLYKNNNVDPECPLIQAIPKECNLLWERLRATRGLDGIPWEIPDQLTVNVYQPGHGIPPHVDTHSAFRDPIMSLSLQSAIVMDFKRGDERVAVLLPRRSLLIMSGESRYDWIHSIATSTTDVIPTATSLTKQKRSQRTSFTFRKLAKGPCNCAYPKLCDSVRGSITSSPCGNQDKIHPVQAVQLEETNVHAVYEKIADHFSETRHKPWPRVAEFVDSFECGSVLVDIGCGNGKYLYHHPTILKLGCDRSGGLLRLCGEHKHNVFKCDCISVPIRSGSVDGCISIAVIHHLATSARRFAAIKEMSRILVAGGRALIYVWARDQRSNDEKSSYLRQNKAVNKNKVTEDEQREQTALSTATQMSTFNLPIHTNRTEFQQQDLLVPWKLKTTTKSAEKDGATFLRFYHVFEEGELEELAKKVPEVEILNSYYDQGNHCVILKKK